MRWKLLTPLLCFGAAAHAEDHVFIDGMEDCSMMEDSDDDRLYDCEEVLRYGTNVAGFDTDDDGFGDGDEILGSLAINGQPALDLAALGANPRRKTVFLEVDWVDDATDCAMHSHRPTDAEVQKLIAAFADAPVPVAAGALPGVQLIVDFGQGGAFVGGNVVAVPNGVIQGGLGNVYDAYKAANFAAARHGYFHYMLAAHRYTEDAASSGAAEIGGDEAIVSTACYRDVAHRHVHTMMHELGHNLGLHHGGKGETCNYKPNYNSLMNYRYQFDGVDQDCDTDPDNAMDFSSGTRITLDENQLDESLGVCGPGFPVEWLFGDDGYQAGLSIDVNPYDRELIECGGTHTQLVDRDDWTALSTKVLPKPGEPAGIGPTVEVTCRGPENAP